MKSVEMFIYIYFFITIKTVFSDDRCTILRYMTCPTWDCAVVIFENIVGQFSSTGVLLHEFHY